MILYSNHLIVLDYDPSTDVLAVDWPSIAPYDLLEIEHACDTLVKYIIDYDVKKLLIDASNTKMEPGMDMVRYEAIVIEFAMKLSRTRLQKSARVSTHDQTREAQSREMGEKVAKQANLSIQSRDFKTREQALQWLAS